MSEVMLVFALTVSYGMWFAVAAARVEHNRRPGPGVLFEREPCIT